VSRVKWIPGHRPRGALVNLLSIETATLDRATDPSQLRRESVGDLVEG
jgi:hypothetical protein